MPNPLTRRRLVIPSPFTPIAIPNIVYWYKADALAQADGTGVSAWPDSSGQGYTTQQATGALQPLFKVNIQNRLPGLLFNGSTQFLSQDIFWNNQAFSLFAVVQVHSFASSGDIISGVTAGIAWQYVTSGKLDLNKSQTVQIGESTTALVVDTSAFVAVTYASPNAAFYNAGSADGTASSAQTFSAVATSLGRAGTFNIEYFNGYMFELLAYSRVLAAAEIAAVRTYLR